MIKKETKRKILTCAAVSCMCLALIFIAGSAGGVFGTPDADRTIFADVFRRTWIWIWLHDNGRKIVGYGNGGLFG